jgi:two-component system chemotaxis sensor kinase CheA
VILPGWKTCCRISCRKPVTCCRMSTTSSSISSGVPRIVRLLNDIFRGFHTIKGGAGFSMPAELVRLCHLTENLFDKLRNAENGADAGPDGHHHGGDAGCASTCSARCPGQATGAGRGGSHCRLASALTAAADAGAPSRAARSLLKSSPPTPAPAAAGSGEEGPDWQALHAAVTGQAGPVCRLAGETSARTAAGRQAKSKSRSCSRTSRPRGAAARTGRALRPARRHLRAPRRRKGGSARNDDSCRYGAPRSGAQPVRRDRPDQEPPDQPAGGHSRRQNRFGDLQALDQAVSQLDLLVSDLQNSVMKTRMQPIGRLFQKYPRIARDLARQLGKDVELALIGEETEVDKTMIEDLADPLIHLIRNAVDHGVESPKSGAPQASRRRAWCASKRARRAITSS